MTPEEQQQVAQLVQLNYNVAPVQVGQEIRLLIQVATNVGVMCQFVLAVDAARALSKIIKEGVERAEVTLLKPQSLIASA